MNPSHHLVDGSLFIQVLRWKKWWKVLLFPHLQVTLKWKIQTISQQTRWPSKLTHEQLTHWGSQSHLMNNNSAFSLEMLLWYSETLMCSIELSQCWQPLLAFCSIRDIGKVVEALYGENPPPIMIVGHSMGGAIAVHTAVASHIPSLLGLCVIDVVEGDIFLK